MDLKALGNTLKTARKKRGLNQQQLGKLLHIPQSHISKIESGLVDLQASTLIEIARVLDLELMLIPRQLSHTVRGLEKGTTDVRPMYRLDEADDEK